MSDESTSAPATGAAGSARQTRGLRADLRATVPEFLVAALLTAGVFVFLYFRMRAGRADTTAVMPFLADPAEFWMYLLSQAFGWTGLLWAYLTVVLGLLTSGPGPRLPWGSARLERLHRTSSLCAIVLMLAHAVLFLAELVRDAADKAWPARIFGALVETFVPGGYTSGTGALAIPIGQAGLYLAMLLGLTFYLRNRIGPRTWRILHRTVIISYALSIWHTLLYGTNVWYSGWPRTVLWAIQIPIVVLLLIRLFRPARRGERLPAKDAPTKGRQPRISRATRIAGRIATALLLPILVWVIVSGQDGGRPREEPSSVTHQHD
ncbi:ferric reductase like protein [Tamaricihabitans halophyticus]|uniref:Ferric reductase like protein n=1 Tax=Tamaricihabitans halophyticus TaxID=1262583 RepID=A0A4R2Q8G0_9PSEU|nr:ferric reductase-like transmembrane domain-containing protein [Tamaricihabitans halophyticus]TCP45117.1 ferric reductase like protein [Tamaricihabitans halophyticus]